MSEHEPQVRWPRPRRDPPEEPSHRAARKADRDRGDPRGDRFYLDDEDGDDGAAT